MFKYSVFSTLEAYAWAIGSDYTQYVYFHNLMNHTNKILSEKTYKLQCEVFEQSMLEDMVEEAAGDFGKIDTNNICA